MSRIIEVAEVDLGRHHTCGQRHAGRRPPTISCASRVLSGQDGLDHVAEHRGRLFGAALVLEGELLEIQA